MATWQHPRIGSCLGRTATAQARHPSTCPPDCPWRPCGDHSRCHGYLSGFASLAIAGEEIPATTTPATTAPATTDPATTTPVTTAPATTAPSAAQSASAPAGGIGLSTDIASAGGTLTMTGKDFKPGTIASFTLNSEPVSLGRHSSLACWHRHAPDDAPARTRRRPQSGAVSGQPSVRTRPLHRGQPLTAHVWRRVVEWRGVCRIGAPGHGLLPLGLSGQLDPSPAHGSLQAGKVVAPSSDEKLPAPRCLEPLHGRGAGKKALRSWACSSDSGRRCTNNSCATPHTLELPIQARTRESLHSAEGAALLSLRHPATTAGAIHEPQILLAAGSSPARGTKGPLTCGYVPQVRAV